MSLKESFFSRHSIKPKGADTESEEFKGISEGGVEKARERAQEVLDMIDQMKDGSVVFLGGATDAIRTHSTAKVYGEEAKEILTKEGRDDILVITDNDLKGEPGSGYKAIDAAMEMVNNNKDKKILIDTPLFIKEFGMSHWTNEQGGLSDFANELLKTNPDDSACISAWFANKGEMEGPNGPLHGPNPTEIAEGHIKGIERLKEFADKFIKDRPVTIGVVGHSWNLDALATYLANDGEITPEGFEKIGGKIIAETQIGKIEISEDGQAKLLYGGKEYEVKE